MQGNCVPWVGFGCKFVYVIFNQLPKNQRTENLLQVLNSVGIFVLFMYVHRLLQVSDPIDVIIF